METEAKHMAGCHDARNAVTILEVVCPKCGEIMEAFGVDGKLRADAACENCGHVIPEGTPVEELKCD